MSYLVPLIIKGAVILTIVLTLLFGFRAIREFRRGLFASYFKVFIAGMSVILLAWILDLTFTLSSLTGLLLVPRIVDLIGFLIILLSIIFLIGRLLNPYDGVGL